MKRTNTGFRGVSKRNHSGSKYEATVNIQGRRVFYKGAKTLQEAVEARTNFITGLL